MIVNKTLVAVCVVGALMAGCKKEQEAATSDTEASADASQDATPAIAAPEPAPAEPAQAQAAPAKAFDINAIAVSDKPLGGWPYVAAPAGYQYGRDTAGGTKDLSRVPFWTGSQLVWVEGKTYETGFLTSDGKTFSRFEVLKSLDQALTALGAVKLADKAPDDAAYEASKAEIEPFVSEFDSVYNAYSPGSSASSATYLIRRADKAIWAVVTATNDTAALLVAEGPLPEAPAAQ